MRGTKRRAAALTSMLAVAATLAACGDDESDTETPATTAAETTTESATTTTDTTTTEGETTTTAAPASDVPDQAATEAIVIAYLIENDCEAMSTEFLVSQTFGDPEDPREELCEAYTSVAVEAQYTAEDIVFSDYAVNGDEVNITVGDNFTNIESVYTLINEDGVWRIKSADLQ